MVRKKQSGSRELIDKVHVRTLMKVTTQVNDLISIRDQRLSADRRDFNLIFAATFMVFLVIFGFARLLPRSWGARAIQKAHANGVIQQARAEANLLASCALMH